MAYVLWNLGKAMVLRMQNHPENHIEIPNLNKPPIKLIFDLPFELRIAVAFVSLWIGFIAFDHITDIVARKYEWLMAVLAISIIGIFLKNTMGIGPSQEDIIAFFEEDRREKLQEVTSKRWRVVSSEDDVPNAIGKTIALQFISKQYGTLYLNDERKQYLSFSKRIEQASKFQLIGVPSTEGVDNVAFYSQSRKQFLSNSLLGYLKVESTSMGSWEMFQLDFVTDHNKPTDMFQLKSVSRGRHLMHQKEGNFHKGFHDKYGEVAYFRMLYYDGDEHSLEEAQEESPNISISDVLMDYDEHAEISSTESLSLVSLSSASSSPLTNQNYDDWKVVTRKARIPKSNPVVIEIEGEGFIEANHNGYITFSPTPENSTKFQVCKNPNESTMGFYSRQHQKYLSLSGILSNKIKVCANKLDNWEKFKLHFDRDTKGLCYVKNLKVWPNLVLTKAHFGLEDKSKAYARLWYNDKIPLSTV